ncbi:isoprenoid biosynthesis glyoxalase ElbB [Klebsiella pneumoniae]|uniref:isoprenoid biosynthesis glyoxalase ElbB n=1 Tax=Klebsiella pneumoniae TaxID=573 RepID=UPI000A26F0A4|nr:isoprenoid biosynthesis glyoxalase ElbB [Klebsiella pneumoniae]MCF2352450.1 type 1 glutamine amidotransferase [Klebsiella pneumoniae]MDU9120723.1 isoprenoid biosynthesis glyoxalase ElbB [Klebsiella pneumoniae]MDU9166918.1 isoprenoid biosynthesis glyoxalase ElbB [Klebsiella pneumoniae]MDU9182951.1 isoprenoid biosynthesis glyoxalase ElbB [Klebsiella pneumoniae]HBQ1218450.1 type 1 glutamine amidotransferase [Klebsiella pneumoniae]
MKKIGVVLGGCGVYDGSEIHEAVITLLAIARNGAQAVCFAPDKPQRDVINHLTGEAMPEQRNVLVEAARIARGDILPLTQALAMHQAGKPLGFMCIAPAMLPKIFAFPLRMTIGTDLDTADVVEEMGAEHVPCPVDDIVVDEDNKVVTTPAYMLAEDIAQAATGIEKLVARVLALSA